MLFRSRDEEVEVLSLEIAKMERLPPEEMKEITDDFYGLCLTQKVITEGASTMPWISWKGLMAHSRPCP